MVSVAEYHCGAICHCLRCVDKEGPDQCGRVREVVWDAVTYICQINSQSGYSGIPTGHLYALSIQVETEKSTICGLKELFGCRFTFKCSFWNNQHSLM